jgi:hypothetical protein
VRDRTDPATEARIRAATSKAEEAERAERAEESKLTRQARTVLTESERRRIWNGSGGGLSSDASEPTNRAKVGRRWLAEIGQVPDWSAEIKGGRRQAG